MNEQDLKKQIAREYYNTIYGAKINFASYDICEKMPTIISFISLTIGVLGLVYEVFNSKDLSAAMLIIGIIGLMLKTREEQKNVYKEAAINLLNISKSLEQLHSKIDLNKSNEDKEGYYTSLSAQQKLHSGISQPSPVFLASWYAHYKLFSEHNVKWMCEELNLKWTDKCPLSFRITILITLIITLFVIIYQAQNCS
ncbi:SLATT domain-containing protein [Cobetia amphilecti]|uniref:SLATT domain-containing protein n=1 Tax=Cobetia amphilecti TaxID=1055104 RepID=UPI00244C994B|nr:SLATT domain-containing protein [Cobetia litoralis]MDH2423024.1 SLATT domain-containing protein [Cobetia litoralis]